jgi:hypothetical protein
MNLKRMLRVSSIAAGVGVAGVFGTTIAAGSAAPVPAPSRRARGVRNRRPPRDARLSPGKKSASEPRSKLRASRQ